MSDLTNKIIELIKQNKSVNEICEITNLSNKQLFNIISIIGNSGYLFNKKYYYDGNISYNQINSIQDTLNNDIGIITTDDINYLNFILISDLHFGSCFERVDLMYIVYDYAVKNNINLIIIGGDLIDGTFGCEKKYCDTEKQIKHLLNDYPFDKNILSFAVLGDHDYSSLKENGQDLSRILKSYRQDIIPLGYQIGEIRVKKDAFFVKHSFINDFNDTGIKKTPIISNGLLLKGHTHDKLSVWSTGGATIISLPPLCDLNKGIIPSFSQMTMYFNTNRMSNIIIKQNVIMDKKVMEINEIRAQIKANNNYYDDCLIEKNMTKTISRKEPYTKKINSLEDENKTLKLTKK